MAYTPKKESMDAYKSWQQVERIRGAGFGSGDFQNSPEFAGLTGPERIMKVLDTPTLLAEYEKKNAEYTFNNATAQVLFNRAKAGLDVNIESFQPEVQALFKRKIDAWRKKVGATPLPTRQE